MAWTQTTASDGKTLILEETYTLPSSAVNGYSSVIKELGPDYSTNNRYIGVSFLTSALSTGDLDMQLYGSTTEAGTVKYQLKDTLVTNITNGDVTVAAVIDLNAYPGPYYFFAWLAAGDEDANTLDVKVWGIPSH